MHILTDELCTAFPTVKKIFVENVTLYRIIPNAFHKCTKLTHVSFYANHIKRVPHKLFEHNPDLQYLSFEYNDMEEIDGRMFVPLKQLTSLKLGDNFLEDFPLRTFPTLERLEFLSIYANELVELDEVELMRKFPNLREIEMYHNHIHCRLEQITEYLEENGVKNNDCVKDEDEMIYVCLVIGMGILLMVVLILVIFKFVIWWKVRQNLKSRQTIIIGKSNGKDT